MATNCERILICGDRKWKRKDLILLALRIIGLENIECIIEGEANGADKLGKKAAIELGVPEYRILKYAAEWDVYGKGAGPIRNRQMLSEGRPTLVLAFHNAIEQSKGTKDMIRISIEAGIRVILISETDVKEMHNAA